MPPALLLFGERAEGKDEGWEIGEAGDGRWHAGRVPYNNGGTRRQNRGKIPLPRAGAERPRIFGLGTHPCPSLEGNQRRANASTERGGYSRRGVTIGDSGRQTTARGPRALQYGSALHRSAASAGRGENTKCIGIRFFTGHGAGRWV
jgi:hypothetical protein